MSDAPDATAQLGSLSQNARSKELRNARSIMFLVGGLTIALNIFGYMMAEDTVDGAITEEIRKVESQGMVVDQAAVAQVRESAVRAALLVSIVMIAVGGLFIVLGAAIYKKPVLITIVALAIYVGSTAVFGFLDPATLGNGVVLKIIVIVGLAKAVQAAIAYDREGAELAAMSEPEKLGVETN